MIHPAPVNVIKDYSKENRIDFFSHVSTVGCIGEIRIASSASARWWGFLSERPQNGTWVANSHGRLLPNTEGRDGPLRASS